MQRGLIENKIRECEDRMEFIIEWLKVIQYDDFLEDEFFELLRLREQLLKELINGEN